MTLYIVLGAGLTIVGIAIWRLKRPRTWQEVNVAEYRRRKAHREAQ